MVALKSKNKRHLLIGNGHREAGSMPSKDGTGTISWEAGYKLTVIPWEDEFGKPVKYTVPPANIPKVEAALLNAHWGSVIDLTFKGTKEVTDVEVVLDYTDNLPLNMDDDE